nr:unnamed protein product [Callosobruchus chinensis]CAH7724844.1 unnamed protein product [Callosobruchus chinensis]
MISALKTDMTELIATKLKVTEASSGAERKPYSAAVQGKPAVIIKPKDNKQTTQTTKTDMLQHINPASENLQISGVKNIRHGGLLVGCSSDNDSAKLKKMVTEKLADKYEIKDVSSFSPRIRVSGMSEKPSEVNLVETLRSQNKGIIGDNSRCKILEIKPVRKRNDVFQALLQVDIETYNRIMSVSNGKLLLGYDVCAVFDAVTIKRCFNCSAFSHMSNECKNQQLHCPRCGENHLVKNCKSTTLKCINCIKSNNEKNTSFDVIHAAWDAKCPCYVLKVEEFKSSLFFS